MKKKARRPKARRVSRNVINVKVQAPTAKNDKSLVVSSAPAAPNYSQDYYNLARAYSAQVPQLFRNGPNVNSAPVNPNENFPAININPGHNNSSSVLKNATSPSTQPVHNSNSTSPNTQPVNMTINNFTTPHNLQNDFSANNNTLQHKPFNAPKVYPRVSSNVSTKYPLYGSAKKTNTIEDSDEEDGVRHIIIE